MPIPDGLDAKDIAILEALQADGRISLSELGRRVGLSQPSMSERVKRLEERGIIIGYGARIDPLALGLALTAIIRLKTTHEHMRACLEAFDRLPYVVEVHRVTGDDCFVLKAVVPSAGDLATIVDAIGRFGPVTTSVVLQSQPPRPIGKALLAAGR
ncbi:Lrp/AsnC family transcriptional regulator [Caulobacter sp. UNC279MFTsu5.1]|uniref:Lrp/AsnC family transcriptional regulator n=1 Tax=Caulobacter sp. UNC279MFTsu5.1 TaxID=1502775 RepID=UPI0008F2B131|nr:Lrp/AsnC family transcriptional regulator [Caulobacter sp. UNC279MFTsu5.1]SFJ16050.1 Lrp/AsnC family transcriptional regulator, leucine-responsive regulatory protein [Caulobacter sp. UNC279MFTsu5.1]